ncbi:hypothetical protein V8B97DRAFT_1103427 [Scleroderma yunnanense]
MSQHADTDKLYLTWCTHSSSLTGHRTCLGASLLLYSFGSVDCGSIAILEIRKVVAVAGLLWYHALNDLSHFLTSLGLLIAPSLMSLQLDIDVAFTGAVFTLLLYDYTLTFGREVELFWKSPRRSWGFSLFVANRYITILCYVMQVMHSFWSPEIHSNFSVDPSV